MFVVEIHLEHSVSYIYITPLVSKFGNFVQDFGIIKNMLSGNLKKTFLYEAVSQDDSNGRNSLN
jgi:hypothetical protein